VRTKQRQILGFAFNTPFVIIFINIFLIWDIVTIYNLKTSFFLPETGQYSWRCRCSGDYVITEQDLEKGQNVVCCSMCTLCIRVSYATISDHEDDDEKDKA